MRLKISLAALVAASFVGSAAHADPPAASADVIALADRIVAEVNAGDMNSAMATWGSGDHAIVDNFPPFSWSGPGAPSAWLQDFGADLQHSGKTNIALKIGAPLYLRDEGSLAYAVFPETFSYTRNGHRVQEDLTWTMVARRTAGTLSLVSVAYAGGPRQ